jgi:hypothetical protein
VRVFAKVLVLETVSMRDVAEGGEREVEVALANLGMKMG